MTKRSVFIAIIMQLSHVNLFLFVHSFTNCGSNIYTHRIASSSSPLLLSTPRARQIIENKEIIDIGLQEVAQFMHKLIKSQQESDETADVLIRTTGYITHKRSFGSALAFVDLIDKNYDVRDDSLKNTPQSLQVLLKRQDYIYDDQNESSTTNNESYFKSIIKSLYPGTKVMIEGIVSTTEKNPRDVVLLVKCLTFIKCSHNPEHIRGILQRIKCNEEDINKSLSLQKLDNDMFGPKVSLIELQKVLKGESTVEHMFDLPLLPSLESKKKYGQIMQHSHSSSIKVPYAKIAKLISQRLPDDADYPSIILSSKGGVKGKLSSFNAQSYAILPKAPDSVRVVPLIISEMQKRDDSFFPSYEVNSILDVLKIGKTVIDNVIMVTVSGWVRNRRRFQGDHNSITVIEIVDEITDDDVRQPRLKCVMHSDCFSRSASKNETSSQKNNVIASDAYGHLSAKGSKVTLQGYILPSNSEHTLNDAHPTLWVSDVKLDRVTWAPQTVKYMLDLIAGSTETGSFFFDIKEITSALNIGHLEAMELINNSEKGGKLRGSTERQWRASELSVNLQSDESRLGTLSDKMISVLEEYETVRDKYPLENIGKTVLLETEQDKLGALPISRHARKNINKNKSILRTSAEGSRWRQKKRPQLEFMTDTLKSVVKSHPAFGLRPLNILDIGGGRGYLSNHISSVFGADIVTVHVIDIDRQSIKNGMKDAERNGLENVKYGIGDASNTNNIVELLGNNTAYFDIIVALHACGALTDIALAHAVTNQAGFVVTPCCFRSNSFLNVSMKKTYTNESIILQPYEWLGMEEEKLVALTCAAELQGDVKNAAEAIHTICSLRAEAVKRHFRELTNCILDVRLKTFPIGFSTRNYCIVGTLQKV